MERKVLFKFWNTTQTEVTRWANNSPRCPGLTPSDCSTLSSMTFNISPWRSSQRSFICQSDYMTLEAHFINWNNSSNRWHLCLKWSSVTKFWNPKESYPGSADYTLPGRSKGQELNFCSSEIKGTGNISSQYATPVWVLDISRGQKRLHSDFPLAAKKLGLLKRKTTVFGQ